MPNRIKWYVHVRKRLMPQFTIYGFSGRKRSHIAFPKMPFGNVKDHLLQNGIPAYCLFLK